RSAALDAHHIEHIVKSGRLICRKEGRAHGSAREDHPVGRSMRELEPLSETAEVERMFADDVTAAEGHHPDLAIRPCADLAVAPRHAIVARAEALCLGHDLKKLKRGPAWAI